MSIAPPAIIPRPMMLVPVFTRGCSGVGVGVGVAAETVMGIVVVVVV